MWDCLGYHNDCMAITKGKVGGTRYTQHSILGITTLNSNSDPLRNTVVAIPKRFLTLLMLC